MNEEIDAVCAPARFLESSEYTVRLVGGCGRNFRQLQSAVDRIMQNKVRKCSTNVATDNDRSHESTIIPVSFAFERLCIFYACAE